MEKSLQYIKTMLELDYNQSAYLEVCRLLAKGNSLHESSGLNKPVVMQQSELLLAFYDYLNGTVFATKTKGDEYVKNFLSKQ